MTILRVDISSDFEGGNIEHVETIVNDSSIPMPVVRVKVRPDLYTELEKIHHMQYFCFRAVVNSDAFPNANDKIKIRYVICNAGTTSYPEAWPDSTVFYTTKDFEASNDSAWKRNLTTRYVAEELVWEHMHTKDEPSVYFSYFPPFTYKRHCELMQECEAAASKTAAKVQVLGQTNDGHDMHYITVGNGPLQAWIIHRQHPGETMAEHYAEGLIRRVLQMTPHVDDDAATPQEAAQVDKVLSEFTLHLVPCMCPDGAVSHA